MPSNASPSVELFGLNSGTFTLPAIVEIDHHAVQNEPISEQGKQTSEYIRQLRSYLAADKRAALLPATTDQAHELSLIDTYNHQTSQWLTSELSVEPANFFGTFWNTLGARLVDFYSINDVQAINKFVSGKEELLEFLTSAPSKISEFFPSASFGLDLVIAPEDYGFEQLLLFINVAITDDGATDKLNRMDQEWWLDLSEQFNDLCINLRYQ